MVTEENRAPHVPVLFEECLELLAIEPGATCVDCTAGAGGHLAALCEAVGPTGRVIAFDRDLRAHRDDAAGGVVKKYADRAELVHAPFSEIKEQLNERGIEGVDALLADIGVSSMQLDEDERGFSFMRDGPLDMRMDTSRGLSAEELIRQSTESELADYIYYYGEERRSRRIAKAIKNARPVPATTRELADIVAKAMGGRREKIHPATRTFQGLRIAVNRELDELDALLEAIPTVVKPGGRAAIISFHSLEDRKVKRCFQSGARGGPSGEPPLLRILTRKPVVASDDERARNPRARSAKLRAVEVC